MRREVKQAIGGDDGEPSSAGRRAGQVLADRDELAVERLGLAFGALAPDARLKEVQPIGDLGCLIDIDADAPGKAHEQLIQPLVHSRIQRVPGSEQDGVDVLVLLEVFLPERGLAVGRFGLAELANRQQAFGS